MFLLLTYVLFAKEMAPKSALAKLRCRILKRPLRGDESNSLKSVDSEEPVFKLALDASAPKIHPPKMQKRKKVVKEKKVIQIDDEGSLTLEGKSEISVLAKDFFYPEFMDKELMTPTLIE